jgi:tetratricopeptide (TPR) repeat protein
MRGIWTDRRLTALSAVALIGLIIPPAFAQRGGGQPNSNPGTNPGAGNPTGRNPGSIPTNTPGTMSTPDSQTMNRPIFLSGKVMFDDGTQPNSDVRLERVCSGMPRLEAHTDSKGRFSFQVGQNMGIDTDAADAGIGGPGMNGQMSSSPGSFGRSGSQRGFSQSNPLWNCELRAAYPGYRSDVVELATRRSLDDPDVGTIVLHRLGNVQGSTISVTTALAPKPAQKNYEKGVQLFQKGKLEEAEKRLLEATDTYPKYAVAWFALGQVQQKEGNGEGARKSFQAAIAADKKYVSPYDQLAFLAARDGKWEDAADYSKQAIQLNPVEFPSAFWCNAVANYNLKKSGEAEKSIQDLLKLDTRHHYPEAENMLGELLINKGEYQQAATHLRTYLTLAPNAKNADAVKQVLAKLDQANTEAKK